MEGPDLSSGRPRPPRTLVLFAVLTAMTITLGLTSAETFQTEARLEATNAIPAEPQVTGDARASLDAATTTLASSLGRVAPGDWFGLQVAARALTTALRQGTPTGIAAAVADVDARTGLVASAAGKAPRFATGSVDVKAADVPLAAQYHRYLEDVGAGWVQVGIVTPSECNQQNLGPRAVQGCASSAAPAVIYLTRVTDEVATSEAARYVTVHEYAHLLQYQLGRAQVAAATDVIFGDGKGLERSADCMAAELLGDTSQGYYTTDCSGQRGLAAHALLLGLLPAS